MQNSYLWRVRTNPPIYFFGTMHVPYTLLWEHIPSNVKVALQESDKIFLELRLTQKETLRSLSSCQYLPRKQTIDEVVSEKTFTRIIRYLRRIRELFPSWMSTDGSSGGTLLHLQSSLLFNAATSNWNRKRPIWILLMLSSFTRENIRSRNTPLLDMFLDRGADGLGKTVAAIESVRDQCRPLNKLNSSSVSDIGRGQDCMQG